jgi:Zn-dependent M28 family amino/carboxypeptidase
MILAVSAFLFLQTTSAAPAPSALVNEVRTLTVATTNEQRFDAITAMLTARKIPFTVEPFTIPKPLEREPRTAGRNIVVTIGEGAEDLVIGAHYDAPRLRDGSLSPGAVDNAASSVMLVHLAASLLQERFTRRIRIVWFDMEELGLIGSTRYVEAHKSDRIAGMLNFDVNGYGDTVLFGSRPGVENSSLLRAVLRACADELAECVRLDPLPPSDDWAFSRAGIPTMSLARLPALEAHQLWLLQNAPKGAPPVEPAVFSIIHTAADTADRVDGASMARMHAFALALVKHVVSRP